VIQNIFSVPIYKIKLDLDIKRLQRFCIGHRDKHEGRIVSNNGGYQSNDLPLGDVNLCCCIESLVKEVETHSSQFAKSFINEDKQNVANMWFNINQYKDNNVIHRHAGFDISGVYYVKTPNDCGNIIFEHPAQDIFDWYYMEKPKELNTYNSETWWMPAEVNNLYLFPAWLKHSVETNKNKAEERISIAFNTYTVFRAKFRDHVKKYENIG